MLKLDTRKAILELRAKGHGLRSIARALDLSRNAVRQVVRSGRAEVEGIAREVPLTDHLQRVRSLHAECQGNLVRVHEELERAGVVVAYSSLTSFWRRHRIGVKEPTLSGRYEWAPGSEMQHDTSPHKVTIGGEKRVVQCASLVLGYSRMIYAQVYSHWTRFECRAFLTEAIQYFEGAATRCTVDNTSVVRRRGTGATMEPAPEMQELGKRFGFAFGAYELGDKNRNAQVERNFDYIEKNFYAGRHFADVADLNTQFRAWCERANHRPRRLWGQICRVPFELYVAERAALSPLPLHIPEVYELHTRRVDVDGYIVLHTNRYSVPARHVGRRLEVRETLSQLRIFDGHALVTEHERLEHGACRRITLVEHRHARRRKGPASASEEEKALRAASPELGELVTKLRERHGGQALRQVRILHRYYVDYPTEQLVSAAREALHFGLLELPRIEKMTLRCIQGDYFKLPLADEDEADDG
jgi:transposase